MSIILLIISACLAAIGQLSLKKAALTTNLDKSNIILYYVSLLKNIYSWSGVFFYGSSFAVYMLALRKVKLSYARSFSALSYVLVIILSIIIFRDKVSIPAIIGIILIGAGIILVGIGYK